IDALGHDWDEGTVTTAASCTTDGVKTINCKRDGCNESKTETISKTGHLSKTVVLDKDAGTIKETCAECEEVVTSSPYLMADDFVARLKDTSWKEKDELILAGFVKKCEFSSKYSNYTIDLYSEQGYTVEVYGGLLANGIEEPKVGSFIVAKGLSKIYNTTYELSNFTIDGTKVYPQVIYSEELTWDGGTVTTPATCTAEGVKTFTTTDGRWSRTEPVAKIEHNYNAGVETTAPTFFGEGVKTFTCADCNATRTEAIPALGTTAAIADAFLDSHKTATEKGVKIAGGWNGNEFKGNFTKFGEEDGNLEWDGTAESMSFDLDLSSMEEGDFTSFSIGFNGAEESGVYPNIYEFIVGFAFDGTDLIVAPFSAPDFDESDYGVIANGERGTKHVVANVDMSNVHVKMSYKYDEENGLQPMFNVNGVKHIYQQGEFGGAPEYVDAAPVGLRYLWQVSTSCEVEISNLVRGEADEFTADVEEPVVPTEYLFASEGTGFDSWDTGYNPRTINSFDGFVVNFEKANKQTGATSLITDVPVSKGYKYTITSTKEFQSLILSFKQWGTKAQNITVKAGIDAENLTTIVDSIELFTAANKNEETNNYDINCNLTGKEGYKYIEVSFSSTSNQIGFVGFTAAVK
ncbi:MAG: hypothetical protein HUJ61_06020, partial [Bacilli bacterium]|nr:hypothetical protein [Bacilli bacterium]